jgi:hypothetical protein
MQTDYFETDAVRVTPDSPHYVEVRAALEQQTAKQAAQTARRVQRATEYRRAS